MYRLFLFLALFVMFAAYSFGDTVAGSQKLAQEGLHKDAYDLLRPWLLDAKNGDHARYAEGLGIAVQSLQNLNRVSEIDELLESAVEAHRNSWRAIMSIAQQYRNIPNFGFIIDNRFVRGHGDGRTR
jgi:hypothetical protein